MPTEPSNGGLDRLTDAELRRSLDAGLRYLWETSGGPARCPFAEFKARRLMEGRIRKVLRSSARVAELAGLLACEFAVIDEANAAIQALAAQLWGENEKP